MKYIAETFKVLTANRQTNVIAKLEAANFQLDGEDETSEPDTALLHQDRPDEGGRRPQCAGWMCIWLLYKILAPLSKNEQINRSKEFVAHLKAGDIEPPKWKALLGNRDLARTFNAGAVVSFFTSAAFGCLHCSTCLEKHSHLQHVLAPQPAGAIAQVDTSKYCAACFLGCTRNANDTRRVVNRGDLAGSLFLGNPITLVDATLAAMVGEQVTDPVIVIIQPPRHKSDSSAQPLRYVDTPELAQRMREGFAAAAAEPEPYLRGTARCLRDRAWGELHFTAGAEGDRQWAQRCWFELQLVWAMQDKLSAAVGDAPPGAALDRLLVEQKALLEAEATAAISQMMAAQAAVAIDPIAEEECCATGPPRVTPADFARCFELDYEIRVAPLVDHLAGFSLSMAAQVTTVAGKVFTALGTKHEFISGALADRTFTAAERKENAAAPAHSMLNESVLGQMDGMIRHRTGASTASN